MTMPRRRLVSLDATPYYHLVSRCVRRAFLCGVDRLSGRSFEHRRGWIEDRLHELAGIFAIDLCAYAVMSNHYHVVVRIDAETVQEWSAEEVIERWLKLYRGPGLIRRHVSREELSESELEGVGDLVETWRARLADLSWFMRCLNEPIVRRANTEDQCKGRFWEGRFKSQALLDERALLQCMAYVDLNPIRAAVATTPETSEFTSIYARLKDKSGSLRRFRDQAGSPGGALPFAFRDYLQLVDWTGRVVREDKRGSIPGNTPPILERLSVSPRTWIATSRHYGRWYFRIVGTAASMREAAASLGQKWFRGTPLDEIA